MSTMGVLLLASAFLLLIQFCSALRVSYDGNALKIDDERRIVISGSIHYPRSTPEMWPLLIQKAKHGGLNAIETYVFWNAHEPLRLRFIKAIQETGLYAVLRIGPYVCAEWNYGGLPVWLHNIPGIKLRTNNPVFEREMANFTTLIVDMMKHEKLFASQGGPIIVAQVWDEGKQDLQWCAGLAESFKIEVPWIVRQENDAPQPMIDTCNGWYCDQFQPAHNNSPRMWTENWTGWYKGWGMQDPHRTAEDLAFSVARFFQLGGTFQNYYMYHGGTNFGRVAGGPYITTSYDYDAPLDEYGNLNQPKWGHLQKLHNIILSRERALTYGAVDKIDYGNMREATSYRFNGSEICFLGNANETNDAVINFEGIMYKVPSWSVSILPNCSHTEVYKTAQVNTQISVMEGVLNEADDNKESYALIWVWKPEHFTHIKNGSVKHSNLTANVQLDQKLVTNDTSNLVHISTDPIWGDKEIALRVNINGHILHAFVNGKHMGTQAATNGQFSFTFETKSFKLKHGKNNDLSLLSVTVGLQNYGQFFDEVDVGIHGPVQLIARAENGTQVMKDLSKNEWTYKVGIDGIHKGMYKITGHQAAKYKWNTRDIPNERMFTWYKTTFKAPLGTDPVVDLMGLGKGHAWVNGKSIGRYWPSYSSDELGCSPTCNYRGAYTDKKCLTNCGLPSQRWYHVPRSFLQADDNVLVLFEEFGGEPNNVKFQTVTIGKVCATAHQGGGTLELSCQGRRILSNLIFVNFGDPEGTCGSFSRGICESPLAFSVIEESAVVRSEFDEAAEERSYMDILRKLKKRESEIERGNYIWWGRDRVL
ncbi:beta-galactosidase 15-like [Pyrus ussuriensis x Pyrus communis]|uniref:beta-galactosidase n=1 Tax=Pyrus ussuriensis x Pyrus communis TaxID=2448454 RepID=A0A5N5HDR4_9ROSA|nr:beta-galactosidase 15-like [Pyrus ussuriensis x Pyrus communis]